MPDVGDHLQGARFSAAYNTGGSANVRSVPQHMGRVMKIQHCVVSSAFGLAISMAAWPAFADPPLCAALPSHAALQNALDGAIGGNGGLGFNEWATIVANDGTVCAIAFSGADYTGQWFASRVISAQK